MSPLLRQLLVFALLALPLVYAGVVAAADPRIVDAAKKEGKLVAYVSMLTENATALLAEFKKNIRSSTPRFTAPTHRSCCRKFNWKRAPSSMKPT